MFWVFDWLEVNRISTLPQAAENLSKAGGLEDLRQRAATNWEKRPLGALGSVSIVAGTGIDLSGGHSVCPSPTCMRGQVDELFKRVWHYFDSIVVNDVFTPILLSKPQWPRDALMNKLLSLMAPLLYLREIAAEDLVEFVPKVYCRNWEKHAAQEGLHGALKSRKALTQHLIKTSRFYIDDKSQNEPHFWMQNPEIGTTIGIPLQASRGRTEKELRETVISLSIKEHFVELTADLACAHQLKLPIGSVIPIQGWMMAASSAPSVADVVLRLDLPVLDGIPTKQLIEFRRQEQDSFIQFRSSLTTAITEHLRSGTPGSADSIANEIRNDVIEPALSKIRRRLTASETLLAKKAGVGLFLGALATTCGLLCGVPSPVSVSAGVGATLATTGAAADKHLEERQQISLNDMYFLWKATRHFH